jgi:inosine-uridine nucleoside N-ribohydrolase
MLVTIKKEWLFIWVVSLVLFNFNAYAQNNKWQKNPESIIFDTDMGSDYDDAGALALLHALADSGCVRILATVSSNKMEKTTRLLYIINRYYGRASIPVGDALDIDDWHKKEKWTNYLVEKYPVRDSIAYLDRDAIEVYRDVLAKQKDSSVTIVVTGFLTNLRNLLRSGPDKNSPLNGTDLIRKKVKQVVCMAGRFPAGKEYNVSADLQSSKIVFENWPTMIVCSGVEIGRYIRTGDKLIAAQIRDSPIKDAYAVSIKQDMLEFDNSRYEMGGRASYDQTAVLAAVTGIGTYFDYERGLVTIHDDGSDTWKPDPNGPHAILKNKYSFQYMADLIEGLMMKQPRRYFINKPDF